MEKGFYICEKNLPMRHRDINLLRLPFPVWTVFDMTREWLLFKFLMPWLLLKMLLWKKPKIKSFLCGLFSGYNGNCENWHSRWLDLDVDICNRAILVFQNLGFFKRMNSLYCRLFRCSWVGFWSVQGIWLFVSVWPFSALIVYETIMGRKLQHFTVPHGGQMEVMKRATGSNYVNL